MKKIVMGALAFALVSSLYSNTENAPQDKYTEWCHKLRLTPEQAEKLADYLDYCKESVQKIKHDPEATPTALANNFESSELYQKTQQLVAEDPALGPAVIQIAGLAALEFTYALTENGASALKKNHDSFDAIEKNIDTCRLCSKLPKKNKNQ